MVVPRAGPCAFDQIMVPEQPIALAVVVEAIERGRASDAD
jgi:hypothetical protein